jgi:Flp pilus assembly protein TadG
VNALRSSFSGRTRRRGQALVEFAMIMPLILVIVLGLLDLGRAVFSYNTLSQAARSGSRVAMVDQNPARVRTKAIASAASLGLATSNVDVCFKTADSGQTSCSSGSDDCPESTRVIGCLAIVRAHLTYAPMTPILSIFMSSISLSSTSIEPIEYVCPEGTKTTCP